MGTILSHTTVSAAQKAALARVLASRYRRLCAGELYVVDGFPLTQPSEAVMIDIGLVLIGLFECLRDHREAEKVLRDIAVLFLRSSMREPDAAQSRIIPDKLDIRHGSEMLEIWMQHSEASRIARGFALRGASAAPATNYAKPGRRPDHDANRHSAATRCVGALF